MPKPGGKYTIRISVGPGRQDPTRRITTNDVHHLNWLQEAMPGRDIDLFSPKDISHCVIDSWTVESNPDHGRPELVIRFHII